MKPLLLIFGLVLLLQPLKGQTPVPIDKASQRPLIDGKLDDEVWKTAPPYSDFKTYVPDFGTASTFATIVMITYDEENIYVAFDCKDPEPNKLKATITARDQIKNEDWVCINFDPFFDQQSLIALYINPLGIQGDGRSSASKEDMGADYVFNSKATIQADGYQVEIEIPFKSIRYPRKDPVIMGFIFERRIQRLSEQSTYPPLNPGQGMNFMTQTKGFSFTGIKHYTLMELLPSVTYSYQKKHESGVFGNSINKPSFGVTGTIGLTSQLILDMALNPDFSQVESDAGQISENQRYDLYYAEKRPFFQEGKSNFDIAATSDFGFFQQAFHTRQISNPLAGIKLTGKINDHNRVGVLYALDNPLDGSFKDSANTFINFAVARLHHAFKNDSYLGAIATMREGTGAYNRVGGIDGKWRLSPSTSVEFNALGSGTMKMQGTEAATDWMGTAKIMRNTNRFAGSLQVQHIGNNFETQTGFLTRSGINNISMDMEYSLYRDKGFIRKIAPMLFIFVNQDLPSQIWERDFGAGMTVSGQRSTKFFFFVNPSDEVYRGKRFSTNSVHVNLNSQVVQSLRIQAAYRFGYRTRYIEDPFTGWGSTASLAINFQPLKKFQSDLIINYSDFYRVESNIKEFSYLIVRSRNTFQLTTKLFIRGIIEYNSFEKDLSTDFLVSFTYIPGTVVHVGYGSLYQKLVWNNHEYQPGSDYLETIRGFFFKASYLWRN